jgi:bacteriocin biosynthesis cyclodehydratase domain-containing protein
LNRLPPSTATQTIALAAQVARVELPLRPRLAPWVTVVDLGDERLQLRGAELAYTIRYAILIDVYRAVEPLLDGTHTVEEIAAAGEPDIAATTAVFLLKLLQANGLLQAGPHGDAATAEALMPWDRQLRFLGHFLPDPEAAQAILLRARVSVVGDNPLAAEVASALGSVGIAATVPAAPAEIPRSPDAAEADFVVACQESRGLAFFAAVNDACLERGTRWLRVAMNGTTAQLGPTIVPYETCCSTCFDLRVRSHETDLDGFAAYHAHPGCADEGVLAPLRAALAAEAALEAARILTGFLPAATIGRFYELSTRSPERVGHDVLKVPRCPSCGAGRPAREPWDLALAGLAADATRNGAP